MVKSQLLNLSYLFFNILATTQYIVILKMNQTMSQARFSISVCICNCETLDLIETHYISLALHYKRQEGRYIYVD